VPNLNAQAEVIAEALQRSGVPASSVSYIEAHGTGTSLGDPIEIGGLSQAFEDSGKPGQFCSIGSVKSNIGHCESAAGVAGITKLLLQMKHRQLVPSIHSEQLNPNIDFSKTPFKVQQHLTPWETENGIPRIAGISGFGAGGSNAHLIIEEYIQQEIGYVNENPVLVILSARNELRLQEMVENLLVYLEENTSVNLYSLSYTLQLGREAMEERLAIEVSNISELIGCLKSYKSGDLAQVIRGNIKQGGDEYMLQGAAGKSYIATALKEKGAYCTRGKYGHIKSVYPHIHLRAKDTGCLKR
jgi:polyketide synthase PksN